MLKKLTVLLALCLLLAGCRATPPETTGQPTQTTAPAATQAPTTQPTEPQFAEKVLVDNEHCTFTVRNIDPDGTFGYTVQVFLENKTDLELMFSLREVSVNSFMCEPYFAATVSPGMKANEEVSFLREDLVKNGISDVTDIEFTLAVYDSTDILAEYLVEEDFTIYPQGEAAYQVYTREAQPSDVVLFNNAGCAMTVTGFDPESTWGYAVNVYLENRTDDTLMFSASNVSVNGFMCDPYWAVEVAPGKKCNTQISWMESQLTENGITQVETISLPVRVYESDDWTDELLSETFTITP